MSLAQKEHGHSLRSRQRRVGKETGTTQGDILESHAAAEATPEGIQTVFRSTLHQPCIIDKNCGRSNFEIKKCASGSDKRREQLGHKAQQECFGPNVN